MDHHDIDALDDLWSQFKIVCDPEDDCTSTSNKRVNVVAEQIECTFCKSNKVVLDDGNYVCIECFSIMDRLIDQTAEWRYYGCEDHKSVDPTRCGLPVNDLFPNASLGCVIGFSPNDSYEMRIIRKYQMWNCMTYKERSLYNIFDTLTINAANNGIPKIIIEEAKVYYKALSEYKLYRGKNRSGLIASSIYMSCKSNKVPRSAKEIANIFNLKLTTMTKGCKKFQEIMKINMASTTAYDFINRYCSRLKLDVHMREVCKDVVRRGDEMSLIFENTPPSIAAGSIYLCNILFNWGLTKKNLSEACEISQVTINKCYKKLLPHKAILLDMEFPDPDPTPTTKNSIKVVKKKKTESINDGIKDNIVKRQTKPRVKKDKTEYHENVRPRVKKDKTENVENVCILQDPTAV